jgi:hypothetical protein
MNENDIARLNLLDGDLVTLSTAADDGVSRRLGGLRVMPYGIPAKGIAGCYPECNVLIPLSHYAKKSKALGQLCSGANRAATPGALGTSYRGRKAKRVGRGRALLIIVEIDINRAALGAPRLASPAPTVQSAP